MRATKWYRRARATERGGMDAGSRSALVVPRKRGNPNLRGSCGGKRGHYAYYGVTGNFYALSAFQSGVQRIWRKWLGRRKRDGQIQWDHFNRLLRRYPLPAAVVITEGNSGSDLITESFRRMAELARCQWLGCLVATGVGAPNDIRGNAETVERARAFGRQLAG